MVSGYPPREKWVGTHWIGSWVGPTAGIHNVHFILSLPGKERLLRSPAHTMVDPSYATPAPAEYSYAELLEFTFRESGKM